MAEDLRSLLRRFTGRKNQPTAMIVDGRTIRSTPELGAQRSKVHAAVDTLRHLLALHVTAASEQDRQQVGRLADQVQQITGDHVELAHVKQRYAGEVAQNTLRCNLAEIFSGGSISVSP